MGGAKPPRGSSAAEALRAAAFALPGLVAPSPAAAQEPSALLQFGRYRESSPELFGLRSQYPNLAVDSLLFSVTPATGDRLRATVNVRQDTWSGATPMAIAPREWRGNRPRAPDGVSGASPYIAPGQPMYLDKATLAPLATDGFGNLQGGTDTQLVHTISGASPEVRRQVDADLRYDFGGFALGLGAGVSDEPDYLSRFGGVRGESTFDERRTTLNAAASYTSSRIAAVLDHDAVPYIYNACGTARCNFTSSTSRIDIGDGGRRTLRGDRRDAAFAVGLAQVLDRDSQLQANLGYTRSSGYLGSPYRVVEVAFIDPELQSLSPSPEAYYITVNSMLESRPGVRRQWAFNLRYARYFEAADAGLRAGYAYSSDDWGVRAHTIDAAWMQPLGAGWTLTPSIRYYTQSSADFYVPYLVTDQGQHRTLTDPSTGATSIAPFDASKLPAHYSSDSRLAGFGTVGGGLVVAKSFARGAVATLGATYYHRASDLKWGGGRDGSFADSSAWLAYASLAVDLDAATTTGAGGHDLHAVQGSASGHHAAPPAPAGVMFDHVPTTAGGVMVGLRTMADWQSGSFRRGTRKVDDGEVRADACDTDGCLARPSSGTMVMTMLELMYVPAPGIALMVMPTYVTMDMSMRGLIGVEDEAALSPERRALYQHHVSHDQSTGGVGDTGLYASFALVERDGARVHATLGVTAPTGDVSVKLRDTHQFDAGYVHYAMQLGSGTWDFQPSVTATWDGGPWFLGAQASAIVRMESRNASGYALGDVAQGTVWAGWRSGDGWSATLRGAYTRQGSIRGGYTGTFHPVSPPDYPSNYGGRFVDLGLGVHYRWGGALAGNEAALEWMQPLRQDFNGYQLQRTGTLHARWQYAF